MLLFWRVFPALFILLVSDHALAQSPKAQTISGQTMGTTYSIIYFDEHARDFKVGVDSLLKELNSGISNYEVGSDVSTFNQSLNGGLTSSHHFETLARVSLKIARQSEGTFDPTVMPLVNLWGFGPLKGETPTKQKIDSIRKFVGYEHVKAEGKIVSKDHPNVQLDFGGIGQGYGVDVIRNFLHSKGVRNFLVELGGEGYASGRNLERQSEWRIGIVDPFQPKDDQQLLGYAIVEDQSFTTSGNYFNYRVIDGKKYGHTISPFTGFPVAHELISVSLFSTHCTDTDAWDTAFLVAGKNKSIDFLKANPALGAVLVYIENEKPRVFISENIKNKIFLDAPYDH